MGVAVAEAGAESIEETVLGGAGLAAFLVLTFALSWLVWMPKALVAQGVEAGLVVALAGLPQVGAYGPTVAGVVLMAVVAGRRGVVDLLRRAVDTGFERRWLLVALGLPPAIVLLALATTVATGTAPSFPWAGQPLVLPIAFVSILLLGGPLQEEFGWRGVALDPLQARLGALGGGLVLGGIWGVWHLPLFFVPSETIYYQEPVWGFLVSITLFSVLVTWLYNNTNRSLLPAILVHATWNWSNGMFPAIGSDTGGLALVGLLGVTTLVVVVYWGPARLTRRRERADPLG